MLVSNMITLALVAGMVLTNSASTPSLDGIWYGKQSAISLVCVHPRGQGMGELSFAVNKKVGWVSTSARDVGANNVYLTWGNFTGLIDNAAYTYDDGSRKPKTIVGIGPASVTKASERGEGIIEWQMDQPRSNGQPTFLLRLKGETSGWVVQDIFEYCCETSQIKANGTYKDQWHKLELKMDAKSVEGSLVYEGNTYKIKEKKTTNGLAVVSFLSEKYNEPFKEAFIQWNPLPEEVRQIKAGQADVNSSRVTLFMRSGSGYDPYELKLSDE